MPSQRVPKSIAKKKEVLVEIDRYADGVPSRAFSHFVVKMGWKISAAQIRYWYKNDLGEIEDMVFDEIVYMRSEHHKLSTFMHRYGRSLRRTTNLTTLTDVELVRRAVRFMAYFTHLKPRFILSRTELMDETAVYFEDPRRETVDLVDSRHVVLRSTGFASMKVTAVLAVTADGAKLPPACHLEKWYYRYY
ncbi:putative pogo transposable element with krab domain [Phytophthora infestans]|uniref:Putative pogo transposable element with krab domain n=1 Tax=Phytophthora infestans TaxID=4787 RepID=A0A833SIA2_PHYIN|nr:putative pogo transposable element with krab domain [Phytophthora infestans]